MMLGGKAMAMTKRGAASGQQYLKDTEEDEATAGVGAEQRSKRGRVGCRRKRGGGVSGGCAGGERE